MDVRKPTEGQTPQTVGETRPSTFATPFLSLRDDIDRMFDNFMLSPFSRRLLEMDPFRRRGLMTADVTPRMDVVETPEAIEVTAELPGVAEKDVDVSIGEGMVTIRGEKKHSHEEKKGDYQLSERSYGTFVRSFRVPDNVDDAHIAANFDKGILTLVLAEEGKDRTATAQDRRKGPRPLRPSRRGPVGPLRWSFVLSLRRRAPASAGSAPPLPLRGPQWASRKALPRSSGTGVPAGVPAKLAKWRFGAGGSLGPGPIHPLLRDRPYDAG